jgi:hypothetical protein
VIDTGTSMQPCERARLEMLKWWNTCASAPIWNARIAYGRVLAFEVGKPSITHVSAVANAPVGDHFPPPRRSRPRVDLRGEWSCWLDSESWSLSWRGQRVERSGHSTDESPMRIRCLEGHVLQSVAFDRGLVMRIGQDFVLRVHAGTNSRHRGLMSDDVRFHGRKTHLGFNGRRKEVSVSLSHRGRPLVCYAEHTGSLSASAIECLDFSAE